MHLPRLQALAAGNPGRAVISLSRADADLLRPFAGDDLAGQLAGPTPAVAGEDLGRLVKALASAEAEAEDGEQPAGDDAKPKPKPGRAKKPDPPAA